MTLKIKPADFERLRAALATEHLQIFARARLAHYQKLHRTPGNSLYQRDYLERYQWDVFALVDVVDHKLNSDLYAYLNDDNIAAALRRLLPEE